MIFGMLLIGIGLLLCVLLPKYKGIIISLIILINAIFSKYQKLPGRTDWFYNDADEEEKEKFQKIIRLILFIIGLSSLIYFISSLK